MLDAQPELDGVELPGAEEGPEAQEVGDHERGDKQADGSVGLTGLRAIWWFALACQLLAALVTVTSVRIPKEEEKEHVT